MVSACLIPYMVFIEAVGRRRMFMVGMTGMGSCIVVLASTASICKSSWYPSYPVNLSISVFFLPGVSLRATGHIAPRSCQLWNYQRHLEPRQLSICLPHLSFMVVSTAIYNVGYRFYIILAVFNYFGVVLVYFLFFWNFSVYTWNSLISYSITVQTRVVFFFAGLIDATKQSKIAHKNRDFFEVTVVYRDGDLTDKQDLGHLSCQSPSV